MNRASIIVIVVILLSGCAGYSMHSLHDVRVTVTDAKTDQPIGNAVVTVNYDYDSYGFFYFANEPEPFEGVTDATGTLSAKLADYRYRIIVRINDLPAGEINKVFVLNGGTLMAPYSQPKYKVVVENK